jgi:hypothetical protein
MKIFFIFGENACPQNTQNTQKERIDQSFVTVRQAHRRLSAATYLEEGEESDIQLSQLTRRRQAYGGRAPAATSSWSGGTRRFESLVTVRQAHRRLSSATSWLNGVLGQPALPGKLSAGRRFHAGTKRPAGRGCYPSPVLDRRAGLCYEGQDAK